MAHLRNKQDSTLSEMSLSETDKIQGALAEITGNMKIGMNPQEATGLNPEFLESLYAQAYHLYNTGKYIDAAHIFRTLILMNSLEFKYVLGLAACHHLLKEYENAIKIYTICSVLDPHDPLPYYHSSDCYVQQQDFLSALVCLEMTLKMAGDRAEFAKIKERSLLSLEGVKQELKNRKSIAAESPESNQTTESGQS